MKVLVTGVKGQLGYDVIKVLDKRGIECLGVDKDDFDLTDAVQTDRFVKEYHPNVIVHCAAYTAVDRAEDEQELCMLINVDGTKNLAQTAKDIAAKLIYISTDYVFEGTGHTIYETDSKTGPLSVYGRSKLEGELAVKAVLEQYFIIRISWAFGINGNNFVKTMLRVGKEKGMVNVVKDQIGSPTYTADLARLIADMSVTERYGTYHATNEGLCSWAEFAEEIFKLAGEKVKVNGISTAEYPTKAVRPQNSRLSKASLDLAGFDRLPSWQDALERYIKDLLNQG